MEVWKYFNDYKIYSENKQLLKELKKLKGVSSGSLYYNIEQKLIAEDLIIPQNRIEFVKRLIKTKFE